jgi:hypothetical protein
MTEKCAVCGETDPYPSWVCLRKAAGVAAPGEQCSYSLEGHARFKQRISEKVKRKDPQ